VAVLLFRNYHSMAVLQSSKGIFLLGMTDAKITVVIMKLLIMYIK